MSEWISVKDRLADKLKQEHVKAERGRYGGLFVVGDNRFMQRFVDVPTVIEEEAMKREE